ncbi:MAG: hypothetical protein R3Y40_01180 [Eubacteriales bacterium]
MTETEKRRIELLTKTRNLYNDKDKIPAIHPRYGNAYQTLYGNKYIQEEEKETSTFSLRLFLALMIFVLYATVDYQGIAIGNIDSGEIAQVISQDIVIQER